MAAGRSSSRSKCWPRAASFGQFFGRGAGGEHNGVLTSWACCVASSWPLWPQRIAQAHEGL